MLSSVTQTNERFLINLRWLSVFVMFVAAATCIPFISNNQLVVQLLMVTIITTMFNVGVIFATKQFNPTLQTTLIAPVNQLVIDCLLWSIYIYLSGGGSNPLISIFLPLVAIAAFILKPLQAWFIAILTIVLYVLLWQFYQPIKLKNPDVMMHMHLLGMLIVFIVSAMSITACIIFLKNAIDKSNKALQDAKEQAMRADWLISLGGLAAGAAHELSTPLASINLLVDELIAKPQTPDTLSDLQLIQSQVGVCNQALNQLTQKAGSPRQGQQKPLAFGKWFLQTIRQWQLLYPNVSIKPTVSEVLSTKMVNIPLNLERTLINLLNNASKAHAEHIDINALLDENNQINISIDDDGIGISDTALTAFKEDEPVESDTGLGVGLLITKATIERLGGHIKIAKKNKANTGTQVQYTIALNSLE